MKIKVLFFANFRELLDCESLEVELPKESSVGDLCQYLSTKGEHWLPLFCEARTSVKIAINQEMAMYESPLHQNDEVAFFPPVTGG